MKKSNLNKLNIQTIKADQVKGGRKLRPGGMQGNNGTWGTSGTSNP